MYIHYSHSGLSLVCPVVFTLHIEGVFHVYLGVLFDCVSILFRCVLWSSSICSYTKVIPLYIPIKWFSLGESFYYMLLRHGPSSSAKILVNKYTMADELARFGPRVNVGSLLSSELDDEVVVPSGRDACWHWSGSDRLTASPWALDGDPWVETLVAREWSFACRNGPRRVIPDFGPFDEQVSSGWIVFYFSSLLSPLAGCWPGALYYCTRVNSTSVRRGR